MKEKIEADINYVVRRGRYWPLSPHVIGDHKPIKVVELGCVPCPGFGDETLACDWYDHPQGIVSVTANGYRAFLINDGKKTRLDVGCRIFRSRKEALAHVKNGRSQLSGALRPHWRALVDYASAVAKTNGWKW
jgi:hypothetical protein